MATPRKLVTGLVLLVHTSACLSSSAERKSVWPPPDYYLEVRYRDEERDRQRVRIWADGLVVHARAPRALQLPGAGGAPLPVFSEVSAYKMMWPSIRQLARLLEQAGLYSVEQPQGDDTGVSRELIAVSWRSFERSATVIIRPGSQGIVVRSLHVINSFLSPAAPIELAGMGGDPEPPHLVRLPEPVDSIEGALDLFLELIAEGRGDSDMMVDAFALAIEADRVEVARELLARIEIGTQRAPAPFPTQAPRDWLAQLRALLPATD